MNEKVLHVDMESQITINGIQGVLVRMQSSECYYSSSKDIEMTYERIGTCEHAGPCHVVLGPGESYATHGFTKRIWGLVYPCYFFSCILTV